MTARKLEPVPAEAPERPALDKDVALDKDGEAVARIEQALALIGSLRVEHSLRTLDAMARALEAHTALRALQRAIVGQREVGP